MNESRKILAVIESVKLTVRSAARDWNATDIQGIEATVAAIAGSVQPLKAALDNPKIAGDFSPAESRSAAQALRKETANLERLVDAAAAFVRSGSGSVSDGGNVYTFAGEIGPAVSRPTESYAG